MKKTSLLLALSLCLAVLPASAQFVFPGSVDGDALPSLRRPYAAEGFPLTDVRLLPSRFLDNQMRDSALICSFRVEQLLHSFRTTAGLWTSREGGYKTMQRLGGWEALDCDVRGNATGHLLSAYAILYASTGNETFKLKGDSLVQGLAEVQQWYGTGYMSAVPEGLIDRNIAGDERVWAPWYVQHKILAGLTDQYLLAGNRTALDVAVGICHWAYGKLHDLDEDGRQRVVWNEYGGVNEAFYNLYDLTGDERMLWLAQFFYHNRQMEPLKTGDFNLTRMHANAFIPKVTAEARRYEILGDEGSRRAALAFWDTVVTHHAYATGSFSDLEHFIDGRRPSQHLSGYTGESCCTYNMLKLTRHVFSWTASPAAADYYERALYNHILAQQDPETGMVTYFMPMQSGAHKVFSSHDDSFWCCVSSSFESHARYAEGIWYHHDDELFVNLFIPSVLQWREKGMSVTQRNDFPATPSTTLTFGVQKPVQACLMVRHPYWCRSLTIRVNGRKVRVSRQPQSYVAIRRTWRDGDVMTVNFDMELHLAPTADDDSRAAIMYGPLVLAGDVGTEGMQEPAPFSNPVLYNDYFLYDYRIPAGIPDTLYVEGRDDAALQRTLHREGQSLTFTTERGDTLRPLYDTNRCRFVTYWKLKAK